MVRGVDAPLDGPTDGTIRGSAGARAKGTNMPSCSSLESTERPDRSFQVSTTVERFLRLAGLHRAHFEVRRVVGRSRSEVEDERRDPSELLELVMSQAIKSRTGFIGRIKDQIAPNVRVCISASHV